MSKYVKLNTIQQCTSEGTITIDPKGTGYERMDFIRVAQNRNQRLAGFSTITVLPVSQKGETLTSLQFNCPLQ